MRSEVKSQMSKSEKRRKKFFSVKILYMKNEKFRYENENFSIVLLFVALFCEKMSQRNQESFFTFLFSATVSRFSHSMYKIPFFFEFLCVALEEFLSVFDTVLLLLLKFNVRKKE